MEVEKIYTGKYKTTVVNLITLHEVGCITHSRLLCVIYCVRERSNTISKYNLPILS